MGDAAAGARVNMRLPPLREGSMGGGTGPLPSAASLLRMAASNSPHERLQRQESTVHQHIRPLRMQRSSGNMRGDEGKAKRQRVEDGPRHGVQKGGDGEVAETAEYRPRSSGTEERSNGTPLLGAGTSRCAVTAQDERLMAVVIEKMRAGSGDLRHVWQAVADARYGSVDQIAKRAKWLFEVYQNPAHPDHAIMVGRLRDLVGQFSALLQKGVSVQAQMNSRVQQPCIQQLDKTSRGPANGTPKRSTNRVSPVADEIFVRVLLEKRPFLAHRKMGIWDSISRIMRGKHDRIHNAASAIGRYTWLMAVLKDEAHSEHAMLTEPLRNLLKAYKELSASSCRQVSNGGSNSQQRDEGNGNAEHVATVSDVNWTQGNVRKQEWGHSSAVGDQNGQHGTQHDTIAISEQPPPCAHSPPIEQSPSQGQNVATQSPSTQGSVDGEESIETLRRQVADLRYEVVELRALTQKQILCMDAKIVSAQGEFTALRQHAGRADEFVDNECTSDIRLKDQTRPDVFPSGCRLSHASSLTVGQGPPPFNVHSALDFIAKDRQATLELIQNDRTHRSEELLRVLELFVRTITQQQMNRDGSMSIRFSDTPNNSH